MLTPVPQASPLPRLGMLLHLKKKKKMLAVCSQRSFTPFLLPFEETHF